MSRLYPCIYYKEDGHCKKYSDDEVTSWCVQGPCEGETPSNADRLRRMTDEELAEFMQNEWLDIAICNELNSAEKWLAWLRKEADEEEM